MKGKFFDSSVHAAGLAVFVLALNLPAGALAQGNGRVLVPAPEHERHHPIWLRIMAFADAPVVGADVRVSVQGRTLADARAATNDHGVFPALIWRPWLLGDEGARDAKRPERDWRQVRISISGGTINGDRFFGHLTADVALRDLNHEILVVNPVTTLVSRLLDERPELKLNGAEALVRRFLKLPENYSMGLALRESSHYISPFFSPVAFMREARDAGGLDAFEYLLLMELVSRSAGHPFRPPQLLKTGSRDSAQLLESTGSSTATSAIQADLYAGLLKVADSKGVGNLVGWALTYWGVAAPGAGTDEIAALKQSLADLQSSVDNLSSQVSQLTLLVQSTATQTLYNIITTQAQTLAIQVNDEENRLMYFATDCPPLPDDSPEVPKSYFCTTESQAISVALSNQPIYSAYSNTEGYVRDNGTLGTEGMLHLYSLWLGQSRQFFRPADSTKMQNLYDYWDGVLTQAADLKIEFLHQQQEQDAGGSQLIALMGNPDAVPPTTGIFQADQQTNIGLTFPPVPVDTQSGGTTVISTQDHTMWALVPWVHNSPPPGNAPSWSPQAACQLFNQYPIYVNGFTTTPSFVGFNGVQSFPYAGFKDWLFAPAKSQWQAAVTRAPTNGSVQWGDWLTQQTQTTDVEMPSSGGFFNWNRHCSGGNATWTATQTNPPAWWNVNLVTNSFQNSTPNGPWYPTRILGPDEQYFWYQ